jgi:hypothetical protein
LRTANVEEDKITRLVDVLGCRVGGGDALEFVGVPTLLCGRAERLKVVIQELDVFISTGELVRGFRKIHVNMIEVAEGKMVRALGGLRVDVTVDDEQDGTKVLWLGPAIFYPFILDESSEEDNNLFAVGFDAIGGMDIDERYAMRGTDPLEVHGNTIGHDVGSRVSSKLIVVTIDDAEGVEELSDVECGMFVNRIARDKLGGRNYN